MYAPLFQLRAFDVIDSDAQARVLERLLEALIEANMEYLRVCPSTPSLYESVASRVDHTLRDAMRPPPSTS
jgi:hypothetical protein